MNTRKLRGIWMICLLLPMMSAVQAEDSVVWIVFADGSEARSTASGFTAVLDGEPPVATLLLPAINQAREAAKKMHSARTDKEIISSLTINYKDENTRYSIQLHNATVANIRAEQLNNTINEEFTLTYEAVERTSFGETLGFDCSSGLCVRQR